MLADLLSEPASGADAVAVGAGAPPSGAVAVAGDASATATGVVAAALDVVAGFDASLVHGLGRLDAPRAAALARLAGAVSGTVLGGPVAEAVEKVIAGSPGDEHLAALAGGRAALTGAVHDALLARVDAALTRVRAPWPASGPASPAAAGAAPAAATALAEGAAPGPLAGVRSWLREVATAGWRGADHELVGGLSPSLSGLLAQPGARRLAVVLDGLAAELRAAAPIATAEFLPVRRWADLWARALLLAWSGTRDGMAGGWPDEGPPEPVSGRLLPLGVDLHEHETAVQAQVHAILEPAGGGPARLVRTSVVAAKVDTITGPAVWRLLRAHPVLMGALAERRAVRVTDVPLLPAGDLVWRDGQASPDEPVDPFAVARVGLAAAVASPVPPLDRHPARIAEPVLVEGYRVVTGDARVAFQLDGRVLAVDVWRLPSRGPLRAPDVAASNACLGLLRWDAGRWSLQPLAVRATVKRKPVAVHAGDWAMGPTDPKAAAAEAKDGDAVAVLRERAGRLLRG